MKKCPNCGEKNLDNNKFCAECGYELPANGGRQYIILILVFFIILSGILVYTVFGPKVTPLSINTPFAAENTESKHYKTFNYTVNNSTKELQIIGKSEAGATVRAYVVYDNVTFLPNKFPDEFKKYSSDTEPKYFSDAKEIGRQFDTNVDANGEFNLNIPINPDYPYGDTWIYLIAKSPKKEQNGIEIRIFYLNQTPNINQSTNNTSKFPIKLPDGMKVSCPECGSFDNVVTNEVATNGKYLDYFKCNNCGYTWSETFSTSIFDI